MSYGLADHVVAAVKRLERERVVLPDDTQIAHRATVWSRQERLQEGFVRGATWMRELMRPMPPMSECERDYRE